MLSSLETSLIWDCLTSIPVLARLVDVTPLTFNRRYVPGSAGTSAAVNSTSILRIRSVSSTEQQADTQPTSSLSSEENYDTITRRSTSSVIDLRKKCISWDKTCVGNRTKALDASSNPDGTDYDQEGTIWRLISHNCFVEYFPYLDDASSIAAGLPLLVGLADGQPGWSTDSDCVTLFPPESSSLGSGMFRWM